jgi:hypothetical protein
LKTQKISFTVEDAKVISENPNSNFAILDLDFFASGENLHEMYVSEETLMKTADTIKNCPLVWEYDEVLDDVGTHNKDEVPCGFVPESSAVKSKKLPDGRTMLSVIAYVWKRYTGEILDFFKRDGGKKPVSVEMSVFATQPMPNGLLELLDFKYDAITVLGSFVKPAIPSAAASVLSFSEIKKEYKKALKEEFSEIDMLIPEDVKSNAKEGLELRKQINKGGTASGLAFARYLINNRTASPENVKQIAEHFSQHKRDVLKQNPSEKIDWLLWGGTACKEWAESIVEELDKKEEIKMSELVTFPYKSMKDVNPSLKGIEPPISLAQANAIAKQADAIGSDDEKNGWAIAISSFKKSHTVKDGKWVKKEAMSDGEAAWASESIEYGDEVTENFAKEDLGKGAAINVDKSKEKVSSTPWGSVDKTALQHKVLGASNYKSLVNDVYLIVESGWEDHPSSSLKYPVMQLVGGTFVYNAGALAAALGRAKGQGEGAAVSKAESIRKKLGLGEPANKEELSVAKTKEEMAKEVLPEEKVEAAAPVEEKIEEMAKPVEGSPAEEKAESPEEEKKEEMAKETPEEEKKEPAAEEKAESPEEEKKEEMAEEVPAVEEKAEMAEDVAQENKEEQEPRQKGFAYPKDFSMEVMSKLFADDESEEVKMAKEEMAKEFCNPEIMMSAMYFTMCKMAAEVEKLKADKSAYMAENEELKKFKADEMIKQKFAEVDTFLAEMAGKVVIPEESMGEFRANAEKFSLDQLDAWKNECKAKSFDFAVKETSESKITRIAFPHNSATWRKPGNDPWAGTK